MEKKGKCLVVLVSFVVIVVVFIVILDLMFLIDDFHTEI